MLFDDILKILFKILILDIEYDPSGNLKSSFRIRVDILSLLFLKTFLHFFHK